MLKASELGKLKFLSMITLIINLSSLDYFAQKKKFPTKGIFVSFNFVT